MLDREFSEPATIIIRCGAQNTIRRKVIRLDIADTPPWSTLVIPWFLTCRMMNVKHFDHVVGDLIEQPIGISDEGDDMNATALLDFLRALRPSPYTLFHGTKPFLER
jgi:hypothetical protein